MKLAGTLAMKLVGTWRALALGALALVGLGELALLASLALCWDHWSPPTPEGLVVRIEARRVVNPMDRLTVEPAPEGRPGFVVCSPSNVGIPETFVEVAYPTGEAVRLSGFTPSGTNPPLDFDGDGVEDAVRFGTGQAHGVVRVASGLDGTILFEDDDPLEYEQARRAFPLGDLDGDGFGELALVHPRMRRTYDVEHLAEYFVGVQSWVTVVSGARLER